MNHVALTGRLTADPRISHSQGENAMAIARWNLAVDRRRSRNQQDGQPTADFISCVTFGKTAEFAEKYFHKGIKIGVEGRIQTGQYTNKDGVKVYTTDVIVENTEFEESKSANGNQSAQPQQNSATVNQAAAANNGFSKAEEEEVPWLQ